VWAHQVHTRTEDGIRLHTNHYESIHHAPSSRHSCASAAPELCCCSQPPRRSHMVNPTALYTRPSHSKGWPYSKPTCCSANCSTGFIKPWTHKTLQTQAPTHRPNTGGIPLGPTTLATTCCCSCVPAAVQIQAPTVLCGRHKQTTTAGGNFNPNAHPASVHVLRAKPKRQLTPHHPLSTLSTHGTVCAVRQGLGGLRRP
jgi:hypothetical protein